MQSVHVCFLLQPNDHVLNIRTTTGPDSSTKFKKDNPIFLDPKNN